MKCKHSKNLNPANKSYIIAQLAINPKAKFTTVCTKCGVRLKVTKKELAKELLKVTK